MSKRRSNRCRRWVRWLPAAGTRLRRGSHCMWRSLRRGRRGVPVAVVIADQVQRRTLERELQAGLGRLQRALGQPWPPDTAVIVQQVVCTDRQLAGCSQIGQRPDGTCFALIRLALQVNGRRLRTDELLAALVEQCVGLALRHSGGPSVLIPFELEPAEPIERAARPSTLRPDPLTPQATTLASERVA